jgi:branched-chain amino acid transport system ATP-binding protein
MPPDQAGLRVCGLTARYGIIAACRDITLDIAPGEVLGLIGPNGAGKTSLISAIAGVVSSDGEIQLGNVELTRHAAHRRTGLGLATVPDNRGLFPTMTVAENVRLGAQLVPRSERALAIDAAVVPFAVLRARWQTLAGSLSGGEQQMLAVAKCLASRPRAILLDEPSQGLAPIIVNEMASIIQGLRQSGLSVLLAEQNHGLVQQVAQRFVVMVGGEIIFTGPISELSDRNRIARLFLHSKKQAA